MLNLNSLIDILKGMLLTFLGYFIAKREGKIDELKKEIETQEKFKKIDDKDMQVSEVYDERNWK
jgi:hypothetical protein